MPKRKSFFEKLNALKEPKVLKKIAIIALIIVLLLTAAFYFFGIKLRFALDDELSIGLNPIASSLKANNDQKISLNFNITNNNFKECRAQCSFYLYDVSNDETVYSETALLRHDEVVISSINVSTPERGSGQVVYSFMARCNNVKGLLCLTDGKERLRSSLITVNYNLTDGEANLRDVLKPRVESFLYELSETKRLNEENVALASRLQGIQEVDSIKKANSNSAFIIQQLENSASSFISLWDDENYFTLSDSFSDSIFGQLDEASALTLVTRNQIFSLIEMVNFNVDALQLNGLKQDVGRMLEFYSENSNRKNDELLLNLSAASFSVVEDSNIFIGLFNSSESFSQKALSIKISEDASKLKSRVRVFDSTMKEGWLILSFAKEEVRSLAQVSGNSSLLAFVNDSAEFSCDELRNITAVMASRNNSFNITFDINLSDEFLEQNCRTFNKADNKNQVNTSGVQKFLSADFSKIKKIDSSIPEVKVNVPLSLNQNKPICCAFSQCRACNSIESNSEIYPVIFIHGHTVNEENQPEFSMNSFTKIQYLLQNESLFINAGELDFRSISSLESGELGKSGKPASIRATYYYITAYDLGELSFIAQKSERIENYALRLNEIIDITRQKTGSDKVNVVAHSMGGLVVRQYGDLFGYSEINKVITVNTPHSGISGKVQSGCHLFGSSKECEDMAADSIFLRRLNSNPLPDTVKAYAIRSVGCAMDGGNIGDGIVTNDSAFWSEAKNFVIKGNCTDSFQTDLHSNVLDPQLYPETYELIKRILVTD